jgi:hypothetical protein
MATQQSFLVFDNSTLANFKSWAQAISGWFTTAGWSQTADTGQVNWGTISSVPAAAAFVYEIWKPGDALTAFYVKIQYGTSSGTPAGPRWRYQVGTGTDGSGNLTGFVSALIEPGGNAGVGQGSTLFECDFSGATDRISIMMWRNGTGTGLGAAQIMSLERTKDVTGANTSDGVTSVSGSLTSASSNAGQVTVVFGIGVAVQSAARDYITLSSGVNASAVFNNNIPVAPVFPEYGKFGNPLTTIGFVHTQDVASGGVFSTSIFGSTITYMAAGISAAWPPNSNIAMRYD